MVVPNKFIISVFLLFLVDSKLAIGSPFRDYVL